MSVRGLPLAVAHGLLGLIVHIFGIAEAWKDELYGVRGSVSDKNDNLYFLGILNFGSHTNFLHADFSRKFSF